MSENSTDANESLRSDAIGFDADTSFDAVFESLAHRRRRYLLRCLCEFDDPMTLADLADEIASRENDAPITELSGEEVKRIYTSLYHTHVPKLAAVDLVRYDQDSDTVALAEAGRRLERSEKLLTRE